MWFMVAYVIICIHTVTIIIQIVSEVMAIIGTYLMLMHISILVVTGITDIPIQVMLTDITELTATIIIYLFIHMLINIQLHINTITISHPIHIFINIPMDINLIAMLLQIMHINI